MPRRPSPGRRREPGYESDAVEPSSRMSSTGTTTSRSSSLRVPASTSSIGRPPETKRPISSSGRCVAESPMRWNGASTSALEPLDREREVRAALRAGDRVHLVEDQRLDPAQRLARRRGEQQVERLGRRDQDVRRLLDELAPLLRGRVAGADADAQRRLEPGERPAQVALDVVVERLERRDVEHAQPLARLRGEPVDRVEERGERLARAGRRLDQDVRAGRDRRPAERLRRRRRVERAARTRPASPVRRLRAGPCGQRIDRARRMANNVFAALGTAWRLASCRPRRLRCGRGSGRVGPRHGRRQSNRAASSEASGSGSCSRAARWAPSTSPRTRAGGASR